MVISQKYKEEAFKIKKKVERAYNYFRENSKRFEDDRKFLFQSTLTQELQTQLNSVEWPLFQVNTLEAFVSRLSGEFSKQMPSAVVRARHSDANDPMVAKLIDFYAGFLRYKFESADADNDKKQIFMEMISGGFSAARVVIDYKDNYSFEKDVHFEKCYDPTLCYFDPMARKNHKGDGKFCGELVPMTEDEFKNKWPNADISQATYTQADLLGGELNWFYTSQSELLENRIVYVCDHFQKKEVKKTLLLVEIPMNRSAQYPFSMLPQQEQKPLYKEMLEEDYDDFVQKWTILTMLPPPRILKKRKTTFIEIWNYKLAGDILLESPKKEKFKELPIIFFDGNSHVIEGKQMTRPYIYNAKDAQKMKNITAIAMMNDLESMPRTKILAAEETLPSKPDYLEAWKNPQKQSAALIWSCFGQSNSGIPNTTPLPPPIVMNQSYFGGELLQLFTILDNTIQIILGTYDIQLGRNEKELSGDAIKEGAAQGNNTALPYINNFLDSYNQIANIIVDIVPKIHDQEMSVPTINKEGIFESIKINEAENPQSINLTENKDMKFDIVVKSDVNFETQKNQTFDHLVSLMTLPDPNPWKEFFAGPGATDLLDNMTITSQESIKLKFSQFQEQKAQDEAKNQQQMMMMNPAVIEMKKNEHNFAIKQQELQLKGLEQKMDEQIEGMKLMQSYIETIAKLRESSDKIVIAEMQSNAENKRSEVELSLAMDKHFTDKIESQLNHMAIIKEMNQPKTEDKNV